MARFPFQKLADYFTVPNPLDVPSVKAVLTENTLGAAAPTIPIYDYHAKTDDIPVAPDDTMVRNWCGKAPQCTLCATRSLDMSRKASCGSRPPSTHLSDRLAGRPAKSSCTR